jgi:phosphoenolpyruvate-protein kinase (PTS system EI component)
MVPLVGLREELDFVKARIDAVARRSSARRVSTSQYLVGTMIELPRAAIRAHAIAEVAEFFSFGTNDLTQTTFGISRDDASSFLMTYQQKGIIEQDPFVTLDIDGVGELVRIASEKGRATRPDIKLGICGEHGGDPASVRFCESIGLDYVSCSPFRVPIARLAASAGGHREEARCLSRGFEHARKACASEGRLFALLRLRKRLGIPILFPGNFGKNKNPLSLPGTKSAAIPSVSMDCILTIHFYGD